MQKLAEVIAERRFKQGVQSLCQNLSAQDLLFYAENNLGVKDALSRIGKALPPATPSANLNHGARYLLGLSTPKLIALISEVSLDHAQVLRSHPQYAASLLSEIQAMLVRS